MRTLYWHDYETFGVDPRRARPSQFAGIRTDEDLNIVGEPLMLYCKPAPDFLPDPVSCAITGIAPQTALAEGVCEADFCAAIWHEFMQAGTCGVGYNSLRFDDEVTRHLFYRCFYDAYEREWKNGNSRWDLIDLVRMTHALRPDGINWPVRDDGHTSFRLEELTKANGIGHDAAHDALSDVYATIAMAKLIKEKQPRLYDWYFEHRLKKTVAPMLDLKNSQPLVHISGMYPAEKGCMAVVLPLMKDPVNANGVIVYDLSCDPDSWSHLGAEDIRYRLFTPRAEMPEGMERIPLKTVHINKCPALAPLSVADNAVCNRWGLDLSICHTHQKRLGESRGLKETLKKVFTKPVDSGNQGVPEDPDFALYGGSFFGQADKEQMYLSHDLNPEELASQPFHFQDDRLPELLFRLRARNWPQTLNTEESKRWSDFCELRLKEGMASLTGWEGFWVQLGDAYGQFEQRAEVLDQVAAYARNLGEPYGLKQPNL